MPTNLPPDYYRVEERFRDAESESEKVALLEEMLSIVPKHKGTDKLRADLRRKLSKLKAASQAKKKVGKHTSAFNIEREGAGQVVVIGHANVGKSALIAALTNASPEVSEAPFTTWKPTPGMMPFEDIQIQLIDTPPLDRDFIESEFIDMIRKSDLILLMVDIQAEPITQLEESIAKLKDSHIIATHQMDEYSQDQRLTILPVVIVVNKIDDEKLLADYDVLRELIEEEWLMVPLSVKTLWNIDSLKGMIYEQLNVIRVYSKAPGKEPDLATPYILEKGITVEEFAKKVHRDFFEKLKSARIWGTGVYKGQMVGRDHVLHEGDIVELRI